MAKASKAAERPKARDVWDKLEIASKAIFVPLVGFAVTVSVSHMSNSLTSQLTQQREEQERARHAQDLVLEGQKQALQDLQLKLDQQYRLNQTDIALIQKIYDVTQSGSPSGRKFAMRLTNMVSDPRMRESLRVFIVWEILERKVPVDTAFDSDDTDWRILGGIYFDKKVEQTSNTTAFWQQWADLKRVTAERWPHRVEKLQSLFDLVEYDYLDCPPGTMRTGQNKRCQLQTAAPTP